MRAKSGIPVASQAGGTSTAAPAKKAAPALARAAAPVPEAEPETVTASADASTDPLAEVPAELLNKSFKDLTKEERIIVSRARSRAMRAKAGKPVGGGNA
jgi:hypothetical protein